MGKKANGEGSITYDKRRKRWRARITVDRSEGTRRMHLGWFKTRDEAHAALVEALSRGGRRRLSLEADRVRVAEYLEDWLKNTSRVNVTQGIQRQRETHAREHLVPYIGSEKLSDLRPAHVRVVKQELLDKGLATSTVGYILGTLSTALNQAVDDELIPRNPARSVKKPKNRGPKMRVLSSEQTAALVESVRGTRYEALYAVAVWLGPRQAELAALTWADVNPEGRLMRIWRSVNTDRAGEIWSSTKTGEEREIILPESIAASLIRHRKMQAEEKLSAGASWRNPDLVFPNTKGGVNRHPLRELPAPPRESRSSADAFPRPARHRRHPHDPWRGGRSDRGRYTRSRRPGHDATEVRTRLAGHEGKGRQSDRFLCCLGERWPHVGPPLHLKPAS